MKNLVRYLKKLIIVIPIIVKIINSIIEILEMMQNQNAEEKKGNK